MLEAVVQVVRAEARGEAGPLAPELAALAARAPAPVAELIRLLGTTGVRLDLGWRSIGGADLGSLAATWDSVEDGRDEPRAAELAEGVQLGASDGGEVYFGLCWSDRGVVAVEIDFEEGLLTWYPTIEAFFDRVHHDATKRGEPPSAHLAAILRAAGRLPPEAPPPPPPASRVRRLEGSPPPDPFARAREHYGRKSHVWQTGPSPAGRTLVVQRFVAGGPYVPAALRVLGADGAVTPVAWPDDTKDVYGVCTVPGRERALVCAGTPGPLLEVDLVTGTTRERMAGVRWSCGFVDAEHLAVLGDKEIRVHRWADDGDLGAPVATASTGAFNLQVGHGCVYTLVRDTTTQVRLLTWRGASLVDEGLHPIDGELFFLSATVTHDGRNLLFSEDSKGVATWLVVAGT